MFQETDEKLKADGADAIFFQVVFNCPFCLYSNMVVLQLAGFFLFLPCCLDFLLLISSLLVI
jgi:hypothetical protein